MKNIKNYFSKIKQWLVSAPDSKDILVLILELIIITLQPFYLCGEVNLYEAGLYLPGIDAIFRGEVPYRDFFHLRGPLELYFQALWMQVLGKQYFVLPTYFYVGGISTLLIFILIAQNLLKTRLFLYMMSLAFIARTFPRVSLTIGGGVRQAWGALAIYFIVRYFKNKNQLSLWLAGLFAAIALATSIEIGVYTFASAFVVLFLDSWFSNKKLYNKSSFIPFLGGAFLILAPLVTFLQSHQAFGPMLNMYFQVCLNLTHTFPQADPIPGNILQVIAAMFNPTNINFKHMTPLFCYVGGVIYLFHLLRKRENCLGSICLGIYGLLFFIGTMRGLWGPGFENAIQPEKVLLFIFLERTWRYLKNSKQNYFRQATVVLLLSIFLSTTIYSIGRFHKRFDFFKIVFLGETKNLDNLVPLDLPRMKKMIVTQTQAQDMQSLHRFLKSYSTDKDKILFFPDIGAYNFILDRPFVGRFPMVSLSWISTGWHEEFMRALEIEKPRYIVTYKKLPHYIQETHLVVPQNNQKYKDALMYIHQHYHIVSNTPSFNISAEN